MPDARVCTGRPDCGCGECYEPSHCTGSPGHCTGLPGCDCGAVRICGRECHFCGRTDCLRVYRTSTPWPTCPESKDADELRRALPKDEFADL